uniref:Uncharacterized protein n=1 Tax=Rhizophora mucronata TaxID=61149 RepID=A0A2P2MTC7_RHIMU
MCCMQHSYYYTKFDLKNNSSGSENSLWTRLQIQFCPYPWFQNQSGCMNHNENHHWHREEKYSSLHHGCKIPRFHPLLSKQKELFGIMEHTFPIFPRQLCWVKKLS